MSGVSIRLYWWQGLGIAIASAIVLYTNSSVAQITPDGTLPNNSEVRLDGNTRVISGGTTRGANLFHSFREFSVPTDRTAFFNNALDIQNILTRVTGSSVSNIDGSISALGKANLFIINPNGIIFGKNASLNIGGSFVATTANAIGFGNLGFFSASNPKAPSPLLTVNPNALLFNQIAVAPIQNSSTAPAGSTPGGEDAFGLRVPDGQSLLLVGSNVNMDGGRLNAFGGLVELGGLAGAGTVGLNGDGNNLSLSFPNSVERSDVFLSDRAQVNVFAGNGGSIAVNARNLEMTGESFLRAGIDNRLGSNNSQAGNISVNATGAINLNNSVIDNPVQEKASGQGGDVSISASSLRLEGGAQVGTGTFGAGKGGNLRVDTQNVQLIGRGSGLFAPAYSTGNAGDLTIKINTLLVRDGATVSTSTRGAGKGGNLRVDAQDVQIIGGGSGLFAPAYSTGNAGDLTIKTNTLLVRDGAQVYTAATSGSGKGGNLRVDAQDVQLIGRGSSLFAPAYSTGNAGDLTIKTNTLLVRDGAQVYTGTSGSGKGGNLTVEAQDVQIIGRSADSNKNSSVLTAQTSGIGDAGNLTINTGKLLLQDRAFLSTLTLGKGKGGNLNISTGTLLVQSGGAILSESFGAGNAGDLTVNATDTVQMIGTSADNDRVSSRLSANGSNGAAGNLTISTRELLVQNGARVVAQTSGKGKGGNLTVDAQDVQIIGRGSGLSVEAQPNSTGDAGDLTLRTNTLLVRDGATVNVQSSGTGTAGNMTLNARSIHLNNNASLRANTQSAKFDPNREQATINIDSRDLIIGRNSNIRTDARGVNVIGGNININADVLAAFENSDITADSDDFRGGNVKIKTKGIFGIQFRDIASPNTSDITATGATRELSGNVQITTPDIDPTRGLVELPINLVDASRQISTACTPGTRQFQNTFVATGRGGLPMSPAEPLQDSSTVSAWVKLRPQPENLANTTTQPKSTAVSTTSIAATIPIVEASGWVIDRKGNIELVALPQLNLHSPWQTPASCPISQGGVKYGKTSAAKASS
ncbi:S-layer family protein [Nostoc sp. ChiSLP03a]|uniref:S-layer family protein n=1 Tax=Nostoc sp. ChiSLP03a TaxID=3075380 RepID=UPI002AD486EF|nr:S-layer family protein [Nostoc sp. ChiSLP03a]MDZ8210021.1 S-layer family protein [Nostoc sp. ChiSLP03a]